MSRLGLVAGALASACVVGLPPNAAAADDWSGPYAGLHAGYGWGGTTARLESVLDGVPISLPALDLEEIPSTYRNSLSGFIGGIQIGYNHRIDRLVVGLETDFSYFGLKGNATASGLATSGTPSTTDPFTSAQSQRMDWLATLRARLGYAASDALLLYATGGLAVGKVEDSTLLRFFTIGGTTFFGARSSTLAGWTAGGGGEYRVGGNWTVKIEYLYFDLGDTVLPGIDVVSPNQPFQTRRHFEHSGHIVRAGLNYRFGGPPARP
jgi:outer membrane immunogenic protein